MKELMSILRNDKKNVEEFIENQIEVIIGCTNHAYKYPEIDSLIPNVEIAKLLVPLYIGDKSIDASEITAILLYTNQKNVFEKYSEEFLTISLAEMIHADRLKELIVKLGGKITQVYTNTEATKIGSSVKEALQIAINSEIQTIANYEEVIKKLETFTFYPQRTIIIQYLNKIIADEKIHWEIFKQLLDQENMNDFVVSKTEIKINI